MKKTSTILAVTSGKGGVGKSVIAVNLAEALASANYSVALIDADFGQSACPILMNEEPAVTVYDLVRQTARPESVLHQTKNGVGLIVGAHEVGQVQGREAAMFDALDGMLESLRRAHDFVLIDTPAGVDAPVTWALDRADAALLVLVDEPTAVADAYRLVKYVWKTDPAYPFGLVVNHADSESEARNVADRFGTITRHFVGQVPGYMGWVPFSASVRQSVSAQEPAFRRGGSVRAAFVDLAARVAESITTPA